MKNALVIMKMTLRILLRKGTVYGTFVLICALATLIFYLSRGDGALVNELEMRISYSYALTYGVLSLLVIAMSCFTIRSQIDAKNIHLMTSIPLDRKWLFTGQALALIVVALLAEFILLSTICLNGVIYSKGFSAEEQKQAAEKYLTVHRKVKPLYENKRDVIVAYADKRGIQYQKLDGVEWFHLSRDALRERQLIEPGQSLEWEFDLGEYPQDVEYGQILYRFQKAEEREAVEGIFRVSAVGSSRTATEKIVANQYSFESVAIPLAAIPETGRFKVKFTNTGKYSTVLTRSGLFFKYQKGTIWGSAFKCFLTQGFHLSVTVLVGLCAGVGLTFAVATFMVIMLFIISSSQGLFVLVMEDFGFAAVLSVGDKIIIAVLGSAMWLTKGLQPPGIISNVSSGLTLEWSYIISNWLPATLFYGMVAYFLGVWMISKKELDKVQV